jgi:HemY protein
LKLLAFILTLLFVSVALTLLAIENPGYVLIVREPWSVEMPLTLFLLLLVVSVALLYFLWHLILRLYHIPRDVAQWRERRRAHGAHQGLLQGLLNLAEANWEQAEKRLLGDLRHSESPAVNYLAAAYAARGRGDEEKRDEYLALADRAAPQNRLAIGMTQARLHILSGEYEQALATIGQVHTLEPGHPPALRLLAAVYRELRDWTGLAALIPELRKRQAMSSEEIAELELLAHRELLTLSLPAGSLQVLEKAWQTVPKNLRLHPALVELYARQLMKQGEMDKAAGVLGDAVERAWDDRLAALFGLVRTNKPESQLQRAELWLQTQGDNPMLLLTLGRLAAGAQQQAKAQDHLQQAIALRELPEACQELGELLERSGQADKARDYYRRGLKAAMADEKPRTGLEPRPPVTSFPTAVRGAR